MVSVFSMLAEVADKEFSVATLWLVAAAIAVASFALCRWRRWAAFIVLPVAAIWLWLLLSEIHERFVGPAILQELGHGYVIQTGRIVMQGSGAELLASDDVKKAYLGL